MQNMKLLLATAHQITHKQSLKNIKQIPNIIKTILRTKNVGAHNQYDCFISARMYVAILDGDDYWTNKDKLKIQLKF